MGFTPCSCYGFVIQVALLLPKSQFQRLKLLNWLLNA